MDQPRPLFAYFRSIQTQKYKIVCFSRIQTRIARVEGKHADHLTTTMAPNLDCFETFALFTHLNTGSFSSSPSNGERKAHT